MTRSRISYWSPDLIRLLPRQQLLWFPAGWQIGTVWNIPDRVFRDIFHDVDDLLLEEVIQGEIDEDAPLDDHQIFCGLKARQRPEKPNENIDEYYYNDEPEDYDCEELIRDANKVNWTTEMTTAEIKNAATWLENKKDTVTIPETDYTNVDPSKLNQKQTLLYNMVTNWMLRKKADKNTKPFYLNLCGRAGCGKTFWCHAVSKFEKEIIKLIDFLLKAAPTGKAAAPIYATTLHSLINCPVPIPKRGKDIPELDDSSLQTLQRKFRNCQLLIIDEKSMVGLEMLNIIDQRLRQIKAEPTKYFGGISIIIMGDFGQLPPVADKTLFGKDGLNNCQKKAALLYDLFTDVIIFDQIMRQLGDEEKMFRDFLTKLANGTLTQEVEWKWLKSQDYASFSKEKQKDFKDTAMMLCAMKKDLKAQNIYRINALNTPLVPVKAENNLQTAKNCDPSTAGGLENTTLLAVGAQMILTTNIWKEAGLTNGTLCEIRAIIYPPGKKPPQLPDIVFIHVPEYKGPSYYPNEPNIVPITPIRRQWHKQNTLCIRRMIPLQPAYALTIHKSQGMSLDKIIVNLGKKEFSLGLSYTALSRCTKIRNLALAPFPNWNRFKKMFKSQSFRKRLQEEERLKKLEAQTIARGYLG